MRRIPALREPHHLMLTPDGKSLLVGDTAGNQMLFLDPANGKFSGGWRYRIHINSASLRMENSWW